jgi:predicted Zn-dependent protease
LITTGLLTLVENVDELAVTLGHELAHLKHHDGYAKTLNAFSGGKTMRRVAPVVITAVAAAGASTAGVLLSTVPISDDVTRSLYLMAGVRILGDLSGRLIMHAGTVVAEDMLASQVSRYSQEKEAAADLTGVRYANLAGYDARRGSKILSKLRELEAQATSNK